MARIVTRFREMRRSEPMLTLNVGAIVGGTRVAFDSIETSGEVFGKVNSRRYWMSLDGG